MKDSRAKWTDFICSPDHAGRYLFLGGKSQYSGASAPKDPILSDFLSRLRSSKPDSSLLYRLHFLLQPRVVAFLRDTVPELVRAATHVTAATIAVSRSSVRGKISWQATLRSRLSGRSDDTTFIVRKPTKSSDTPENRLLKLFLTNVTDSISETILAVGTSALHATLQQQKQLAETLLREPYIRELPANRTPTAIMYQRALRHRNWRYGELARLCKQFDEVIREKRWLSILALLKMGWFEPGDVDDLFELYSLVVILDVLEKECGFGSPRTYGLIRPKRNEVAHFVRDADNVAAKVYFDQSPTHFLGIGSEYYNIVKTYGVRGSSHRPDISVVFEKPDQQKRVLLVEMKKSEDLSYMRDSIYKVLGYLRDFRELWVPQSAQSPKAIVLFPTGVTLEATNEGHELVLADTVDRDRLAGLLARCLA